MRITVRFFAGMREHAGAGAIGLDVPDGTTVDEAVFLVMREMEGEWRFPARLMKAVNEEYVRGDAVLRDGDELALIPPVSGGAVAQLRSWSPERAFLWVRSVLSARCRPGEGAPEAPSLSPWRAMRATPSALSPE